MLFRSVFSALWTHEAINAVVITIKEPFGTQGRGGYFDSAGIIRDLMQNHLLQLLCLVAMEPLCSLDPDVVRDEKLKVLRSLRPMGVHEVAKKTVRGQYRAGTIAGQAVPRTLALLSAMAEAAQAVQLGTVDGAEAVRRV